MTHKKSKTQMLLSRQPCIEPMSFVPSLKENQENFDKIIVENLVMNFIIHYSSKSTYELEKQSLDIEEIKNTIKEEILNEISNITEKKINLIMTASFFTIAIIMLFIGFFMENLVYKIYGTLSFILVTIHALWVIINERKTRKGGETRDIYSRT